jgi:hypothetical protein
MKKLFFITVLICLSSVGVAQIADTLYTQKNQKIACKIYEVNEFEIRYRMANALDGPVFVIDKYSIRKYTLANGYSEVIMLDELSLENEHKEIIGNREVIKINPFSVAFNHISLGYEKVIKVGMNLDVQAGYVNSTMTNPDYASLGMNTRAYHVGAYIKPGIKFFLGQDFSVKGLKYAHPLKGRYVKLDLAVSYLNFQDVKAIMSNYNGQYPYVATYTVISTDINTVSYGGFLNYGRQFILGNLFTLEYYFGAGFTGQSINYTNSNYLPTLRSQYGGAYYREQNIASNYYGFARIPGFGLSGTVGLRVGYIIPSKKTYGVKNAEKKSIAF